MVAKMKAQGKRKAQVHNTKKGAKKLKKKQLKDYEKSLPVGMKQWMKIEKSAMRSHSKTSLSEQRILERRFRQRLRAQKSKRGVVL